MHVAFAVVSIFTCALVGVWHIKVHLLCLSSYCKMCMSGAIHMFLMPSGFDYLVCRQQCFTLFYFLQSFRLYPETSNNLSLSQKAVTVMHKLASSKCSLEIQRRAKIYERKHTSAPVTVVAVYIAAITESWVSGHSTYCPICPKPAA